MYGPAGSPFFPGGVTRVTSSKFQPFNPRYRSPNSRDPKPHQRTNSPPPPASSPPNIAGRLSRPVGNMNK